MAALNWAAASRSYQAGVDQGVLYLSNLSGIAWDGLVSVEDKPLAEISSLYFEGIVSGVNQPGEDCSLVISAFTYPDEFELYTGYADIYTKQPRKTFGFSWRSGDTKTGQIHLVYNATAVPSDTSWQTLTKATEATLFKWDISAKPFEYPGIRPAAHLIIDLALAPAGAITDLTNILYGTASTNPRLPTLLEIVQKFDTYAAFKVVDNGDGTWTATGSSTYIPFADASNFTINSPTAVMIDATTYVLSSDY